MEKLGRFVILSIVYLILMVLSFIIPASIFWLFGANWMECLQHPAYAIPFGLISIVGLGIIFYECFDENFKSK